MPPAILVHEEPIQYGGPEVNPSAYFSEAYRPVEMHLYHLIVMTGPMQKSYRAIAKFSEHSNKSVQDALKNLIFKGFILEQKGSGRQPNCYSVADLCTRSTTLVADLEKGSATLNIYKNISIKKSKTRRRVRKSSSLRDASSTKEASMANKKDALPFSYPKHLPSLAAKPILDYAQQIHHFPLRSKYAQRALRNASERLEEGYTLKDLYGAVDETMRRIQVGWNDYRQKDLTRIWGANFENLLHERPTPGKTLRYSAGASDADLEAWKRQAIAAERRKMERVQ